MKSLQNEMFDTHASIYSSATASLCAVKKRMFAYFPLAGLRRATRLRMRKAQDLKKNVIMIRVGACFNSTRRGTEIEGTGISLVATLPNASIVDHSHRFYRAWSYALAVKQVSLEGFL